MWGVCHFFTKSIAMATSFEISENEVQIYHLNPTFSFGVKIAKISKADSEIIVLREIIKKEKIKNKETRNVCQSLAYSTLGAL